MGVFKLGLHTDKTKEKTEEVQGTKASGNRAFATVEKTEEAIKLNIQKKKESSPRSVKRVIILKSGLILSQVRKYGASLEEGTRLLLKREPVGRMDNKWSIAVYTEDNFRLGYLPFNKDQSTARLMDAGKIITAEVGKTLLDTEVIKECGGFVESEDFRVPITVYMEISVEGECKNENEYNA